MKILVAYFSQTGNTKKVARQIARKLGADMDEIKEKGKNDKKPGKDVQEITYKKDPSKYDMVVIGSPVWAFRPPPVTRKYLSENKFRKTAFFCTYGLWTGFFFRGMKSASKEPVAKLKVHMKKVDKPGEKLDEFCSKIKG